MRKIIAGVHLAGGDDAIATRITCGGLVIAAYAQHGEVETANVAMGGRSAAKVQRQGRMRAEG